MTENVSITRPGLELLLMVPGTSTLAHYHTLLVVAVSLVMPGSTKSPQVLPLN